MAKRGRGFFTKMGGEGGPKGKTATHPLPPIAEQGRGAGSPAAANPDAPGSGGGCGPGGKEEGYGGPIPGLTLS